MLEEKKQDLKVWEAVLVEVQVCGIHPWENRDLLAKLWECLAGNEVKELATLVTSISEVLVDLGLAPIWWIPQLSSKAWAMLEVVGTVLERLREVPASTIEAWT
jgi:hypothetical protein